MVETLELRHLVTIRIDHLDLPKAVLAIERRRIFDESIDGTIDTILNSGDLRRAILRIIDLLETTRGNNRKIFVVELLELLEFLEDFAANVLILGELDDMRHLR